MDNITGDIREALPLIQEMVNQFGVDENTKGGHTAMFVGVIGSEKIGDLLPEVARYLGPPYKAAGEGVFFKNLFDSFAKSFGGMRKEQIYFRKELAEGVVLFCAFWPWATNPPKTSIRVGFFGLEGKNVDLDNLLQALGG